MVSYSINENVFLNNIWELYGVRENPFSTSPILVAGGTLPIDSFVGREEDMKRLGRIFASQGGSRTLIYGDVGVGKTSFVNVARYYAYQKGFFTPFKEIGVHENWSSDAFILNTLSGIYSTLKLLKTKVVKDSLFQKLETLLEIESFNTDIGLSIAGVGANYSKQTKQASKITTSTLQDFFQEIVSEIINKKKHEMIIHYNNLELIPEKKLRRMFDDLRDFFQIPNVHFVFVGNQSVCSCFQGMPRISSILTDTPIHIETLNIEEIEESIKKRFKILAIPKFNYIIPFTKDALMSLFDLWEGNIRYILNSLSTAMLEVTVEKPEILDKNTLAIALKQVLDKRYLNNLTPRSREILSEIVKHNEITNKALSDKLNMPCKNISSFIKDLKVQGCVYLRRKNEKDAFWSAEPKIKWILLEIDKEKQRTVFSYDQKKGYS